MEKRYIKKYRKKTEIGNFTYSITVNIEEDIVYLSNIVNDNQEYGISLVGLKKSKKFDIPSKIKNLDFFVNEWIKNKVISLTEEKLKIDFLKDNGVRKLQISYLGQPTNRYK